VSPGPGRRLGLKPGTVYPILIRLAERGMVEAGWEQDPPRGRPPRHLYRLSPTGTGSWAELGVGAQAVTDRTGADRTVIDARSPGAAPSGQPSRSARRTRVTRPATGTAGA
jgi:hypothetical protein